MSTTTTTLTAPIELQEFHSTTQSSFLNTKVQSIRENPNGIEHEPSLRNQSSHASLRTAPSFRSFLVVFQLCMINFLSSFTNGLITVGLPTIAVSTSLPRSLYLWPTSVYGLTSGATLLLAGSIADLFGARPVEILGCVILSVFTLACGLANTGIQLVIFRALVGVGMSMHLPASVSMVAAAMPQGKGRNISFGCLGLSQPLGFSAGLVISGIMIERSGWRSSFYLSGGALVLATIVNIWALPKSAPQPVPVPSSASTSVFAQLLSQVDWVGGIISSAGLAILSYVLALLSVDLSSIHKPSTASLLAISLVLLLSFPVWMHRRERSGKPALIPNTLWKKSAFTCTCIMVTLSSGAMNSMELFSSLYFQEIQNTSTLFTSLRLLPNLLVGVLLNFSVGMFVDKVSVRWLVAGSSMLCAGAPLLMALVNPDWSYWYMEFWAQILAPMSGDVLFTVGLLIISDEFPEKTQALAGAVFNTVTQFGLSLGITVCQVVSLAISSREQSHSETNTGPERTELLKGYQASFWSMFAFLITCAFFAIGGLRKAGNVGVKRD